VHQGLCFPRSFFSGFKCLRSRDRFDLLDLAIAHSENYYRAKAVEKGDVELETANGFSAGGIRLREYD